MFVFFAVTKIWWPAVVMVVVVVSLCLIYFNTFYELLPEGIMLSCGFVARAISYSAIISMTDEVSKKVSFCLCKERVLIKYMDGDEIKYTYASPSNREQFRELVNREIAKYTESLKSNKKGVEIATKPKEKRVPLATSRLDDDDLTIVKSSKDSFNESKVVKPTMSKKEQKKKELEEKKLLNQLRKEKQKETKLAVKQEKAVREKQQRILMEQSKKNDKLYQEKLKKQDKAKKKEVLSNKIDEKQKRFVERETAKAEKLQEKKKAKVNSADKKKQAEENKERKIAKKEVKKLKQSDKKANLRKEKQDKKSE